MTALAGLIALAFLCAGLYGLTQHHSEAPVETEISLAMVLVAYVVGATLARPFIEHRSGPRLFAWSLAGSLLASLAVCWGLYAIEVWKIRDLERQIPSPLQPMTAKELAAPVVDRRVNTCRLIERAALALDQIGVPPGVSIALEQPGAQPVFVLPSSAENVAAALAQRIHGQVSRQGQSLAVTVDR